jgi:signal transduction histidine kinase
VNNFAEISADLAQDVLAELESQSDLIKTESLDYIKETLNDIVENVTEVKQQGLRADNIIRNMLLLARTDSGSQRQITDLNALVATAIQLAYHSLVNKWEGFNIKIETEYDPSLPEVAIVSQDINRALINIIDNGCYAAYKKKQEIGKQFIPQLFIKTQHQGENFSIIIRDNGNGIAPNLIDKIFDPFFTTKPAGDGTGLGLSIIQDIIVGQHQGDIQVKTEVGAYTEFIIIIPISLSINQN